MARYVLSDLLDLVRAGLWEYATPRARTKATELGYGREQVESILCGLEEGDFRKEFGVCKTDFDELYADDFRLWWDEDGWRRCAPNRGVLFYIKLASYEGPAGKLCAVISFGLS
jgi:hypothetical protein